MEAGFKSTLLISMSDQIHFILNEVKITFFEFPFQMVPEISIKIIL